jgi:hypothetical protein
VVPGAQAHRHRAFGDPEIAGVTSTPYSGLERRLAALLDSAPRLRALAKAGYQRANYLLRGWRQRPLRLHPEAAIERVAGGERGAARQECFFGYFGMQPWSRDGRRQLYHRWQPPDGTTVGICVRDGRSATESVIAETRAWNFQQGAMAQWLSREGSESIVFNDVVDRKLVCRMVAGDGGEEIVPWPIQALHPLRAEALSINYRRLWRLRPDYGYDVPVENFSPDQPLAEDGIWRVDLRSADAQLVIPLRQLAAIEPRADMAGADHKVNHAVYSPDGGRFVFMHRWLGARGKFSRLYCASSDGTGLRLLLDNRVVSHYAWRDDANLLVWARTQDGADGYHVLDVVMGARESLCSGALDHFGDGHPSFSPDRRWIVTDTYPDRGRMRRLLLCHPSSGEIIEVGAFRSPWRYDGVRRCDLHPRWSPDGGRISIDSSHEGVRANYAIDVTRLVASRGGGGS